jgi:hypothetical protein
MPPGCLCPAPLGFLPGIVTRAGSRDRGQLREGPQDRVRVAVGKGGQEAGVDGAEAAGSEPVIDDVRQVPVDTADEAWERVTDDWDARGVEAARFDFTGGWNVTVAVMEFVREEPLERELRRRSAAALRSVDGVESAEEMDREVWFITGAPSGEALVRAVPAEPDDVRDRSRPLPDLLQGSGHAEDRALTMLRRPTRSFFSIARPDIPARPSRRSREPNQETFRWNSYLGGPTKMRVISVLPIAFVALRFAAIGVI